LGGIFGWPTHAVLSALVGIVPGGIVALVVISWQGSGLRTYTKVH